MSPEFLVVAGEPSGDVLAAEVVERCQAPSYGLGGPRLATAGTELVADLGPLAVMGFSAVLRRAPDLARAAMGIARVTTRRRPRAALLVGFSEMNARLAPWLRRRGVRVLWYAPPQAWAWRPGRARRIARHCDRLAVLLPFEARWWEREGALAEYVGHPAAERSLFAIASADAKVIALLPGSRTHELRAHLAPMLEAARVLAKAGVSARLVLAEALEPRTAAWATASARSSGVAISRAPFTEALRGVSLAVVASGTATLECAAAGVPPIIVYRTDAVTYAVAKRLVHVPHVGLPNLVLGERAFPELLQGAVTARRIAKAAAEILRDHDAHRSRCLAVRDTLRRSLDDRGAAERVAVTLRSWLA